MGVILITQKKIQQKNLGRFYRVPFKFHFRVQIKRATQYSVSLYCQEVIDMYQLAFLEAFDTDHSIETVHKTIYFEKLREEITH